MKVGGKEEYQCANFGWRYTDGMSVKGRGIDVWVNIAGGRKYGRDTVWRKGQGKKEAWCEK